VREALQHLRVGEYSLTSVAGSSIVEAMEVEQTGRSGERAIAATKPSVSENRVVPGQEGARRESTVAPIEDNRHQS
jgi:hypothetical protein